MKILTRSLIAAAIAVTLSGGVVALPAQALGSTSLGCTHGVLATKGSAAGRTTATYGETWGTKGCGEFGVRLKYSRNGQPGYVSSWKYSATLAKLQLSETVGGEHTFYTGSLIRVKGTLYT